MTEDPFLEDINEAGTYRQRSHFNVPLIAGIFAFAMLSLYAFAAMATQIDDDLLPGNELSIPVVRALPGVDGGSDKDSAETIDERINILVLGLDQRLDDASDEPYRTDSVVIFTIDPFAKTAGAFSIPRDTLVDIPDGNGGIYTKSRINEAYEIGEYTMLSRYPGGGPQLAMDTINNNFGIPIDYYVVMNWANFIDIIDELGGIDVTIERYAYDPAYADCSFCSNVYPVEFVPGTEHMDGLRALAYARIRKSDDDFRRIERQQAVMRAVARKALSLDLFDVGKAKGLYDRYTQSIRTNIPAIKVPGLALLGTQVGLDNLRTVSAAGAMYPCNCGPAAVLSWDPVKFDELKAQVFSDSILTREYARVEVLNGTVVPELAGDFAGVLRGRGVSPEQIIIDEFADGRLYDTTIVIDVNDNADHTAGKVAEWLGLPGGSVISGTDARAADFLNTSAEVVVVLGADVQMPLGSFAGTQTGG
ncbi:MAG TPA: LCP family protein [Dehalococcoidia bacterium]